MAKDYKTGWEYDGMETCACCGEYSDSVDGIHGRCENCSDGIFENDLVENPYEEGTCYDAWNLRLLEI